MIGCPLTGGNSGSGAFDDSGQLIGILVRGQRDYVYRSGCYTVNTIASSSDVSCESNDGAEELTYAFRALAAAPGQ